MPDWSLSRMRPVDWAAVVLIGGLMAGVAYLALGMGFGRIRELQREQWALAQELEELTSVNDAVMEARAVLEDLKVQQEELARLVPYSMSYYGALTGAAEAAGLQLESVAPGTLQQSARYLVLPVEIVVRGEFARIHDFVFRLTHLPRLTKIERLGITATDDPGACALSLTVRLYAALPGAAL